MSTALATLNNTFNINTIDIVGVPALSSVYNEFDDFGLLVGLNRLNGETSVAYKQRILDVYAHRANSTYIGMINGITRELGLSLFKPFRIRPKISAGLFTGANPIFNFNGPFLELWADKNNNILDLEINIFDQNGIAYTILELYNYINTNSIYFVADQLDTTYQYDKSMTILNQTNLQLTIAEPISSATRFTLSLPNTDGGFIQLSDITFTDTFAFSNQVSSLSLIETDGDYYINPYTGDIATFTVPANGTITRYNYIRYNNAYLIASPIIIHNMQNSNFNRIIFEQILGDDGIYYNGVPNEFGADLINELISYYPLYYAT